MREQRYNKNATFQKKPPRPAIKGKTTIHDHKKKTINTIKTNGIRVNFIFGIRTDCEPLASNQLKKNFAA